jgi:hypothetical protein
MPINNLLKTPQMSTVHLSPDSIELLNRVSKVKDLSLHGLIQSFNLVGPSATPVLDLSNNLGVDLSIEDALKLKDNLTTIANELSKLIDQSLNTVYNKMDLLSPISSAAASLPSNPNTPISTTGGIASTPLASPAPHANALVPSITDIISSLPKSSPSSIALPSSPMEAFASFNESPVNQILKSVLNSSGALTDLESFSSSANLPYVCGAEISGTSSPTSSGSITPKLITSRHVEHFATLAKTKLRITQYKW